MVEALEAMETTRSSMAFMEALRILKSPKSNAETVAKAIEFDPKLTSHLLREVNSPFYALTNKVEKLDHAISLLGFDRIEEVLNKAAESQMFEHSDKSYRDMLAFRRHGAAVACIAEKLAEELKLDKPEEFFEAGMMHDIGKYLYLTKFTKDFDKLVREVRETGEPMYKVERKYLGTDHAELGELMAEAWGLSDTVRAAVRYHHEISDKERDRLTTREAMIVELVSYANLLSHSNRFGGPREAPEPPAILTHDDVSRCITLAQSRFEEVSRELDL